MTSRVTARTVTFTHPFMLEEIDHELPAGVYQIETGEETLDGVSFLVYRRTSTHIRVRPEPGASGAQMWAINLDSLASALLRDLQTCRPHQRVRPSSPAGAERSLRRP